MGLVGFVSSRFCSEMVSNVTGTAKLSSIALVWPGYQTATDASLATGWQRNMLAYISAKGEHKLMVARKPSMATLRGLLDARVARGERRYPAFGDDPVKAGFVGPSAQQYSSLWHAAVRIQRQLRARQLQAIKFREVPK